MTTGRCRLWDQAEGITEARSGLLQRPILYFPHYCCI